MEKEKLKRLLSAITKNAEGYEDCVMTATWIRSDRMLVDEVAKHEKFYRCLEAEYNAGIVVAERIAEMKRTCVPCWKGGEI